MRGGRSRLPSRCRRCASGSCRQRHTAPRRLAPADIPILYYHHVPSQKSFHELCARVEAGREVVPLSRAVAALRGEGPPLPEKPLVLDVPTMAWSSQIANAAPVLQTEGLRPPSS